MTPPECSLITCDENAKSCSAAPAGDDAPCSPADLCQVNGVCKSGVCTGEPKDCSFSPLTECNTVACNPNNGACEPTPDAGKNGQSCSLSGEMCNVGRTCSDGQCAGGTAKDCSALTVGCTNGVCDPNNGACVGQPVPAGGTCFDGIDQCHTGVCDANASCNPMPVADGTSCNDYNACTTGDACTAGVCGGQQTAGCVLYFTSAFETCPDGFTMGGDWECGTPSSVGPETAHGGSGVLATKIASKYSSSQSYDTDVADSAPISLSGAVAPKLSFWVWIDTEGSSWDGFNLKASTDNGATFTQVTTVTPDYNLTVNSQPAWGGHQSAAGWQNYTADLSAFVGQQVILRFAFRSDSGGNYPGVYIDDLLVAEPSAIPLEITTASLPSVLAGSAYTQTLQRAGGDATAVWTIESGTNIAWLSIDSATGALSGTPSVAEIGPVSLTVKVSQPGLPGNFAQKTFDFAVQQPIFTQDFEGGCPNGWTLGGDWQCGTPSSVGPATAHSGTQCIATKIASDYSSGQSWTTAVATSPTIDLTGTTSPSARFWMWIDTEGSTWDGANLKVSTDGGATFSIVTGVTPAYTLTVNSESAWGGHQGDQGWQLVTADLTPYANQQIKLRFAFRSDSSGQYPGVYIDDVIVAGP
jgi:hypothetical protein